ncbi:PREDICTED: cleavage and polyadenylation specificity factor subunit 1-like [Wasmannia auropunctata]|uniref:cleavage and polyadenylation specificity factor subunit 1-like n=1 Tax=Wasmannia auropunctata TaxID=64793 RepID=UPI0005EDB74E|nr:PREDICTED: cleavage and polyadenylation specificity factor subunit 1-like [Wasmannia auropunctata]
MYQPESRESLGGQKLIRKADFHLGQKVNTFFRIRVTDPANDKKQFSGPDKRYVTMYASLDGSLGYTLPVPEKTYRRLLILQNMVMHICHIAGLNPKAYRTYKSYIRNQGNPAKGHH